MSNRYRFTITLLLGALLTGGDALAEGVNVKGYVFGGGNLADVGGSVQVNIESGLIEKDVHGGGALANTNINNATNYGANNEEISSTQTNTTTVSMTGGTVLGDIYGGGLGNADTAAWVYGDVALTLDGTTLDYTATPGGHIFGGNNINGAPKGEIKVDINQTISVTNQSKDVLVVYGGGNQANYDSISIVNIHNCDNIIGSVYGGGNQATVKGTDVNVYGGHIDSVFGGGYGASVTEYGTDVHIYGGEIDAIFGGNNQSGTVTGDISVNINKQTETGHSSCEMHLGDVYGGGNLAASGPGSITIGNTGGSQEGINNVYGGANNARVTGDITLNITGGSIQNVFGGNNTGNQVDGDITVNINWNNQNTIKYLYDVFGGGNHALTNGSTTVNITNGTVSHDVYGGGSQANVTGAVTVNIGDSNGTGTVNIGNDVYGGGALASTNTGNQKEDESIKTDSLVTTVNLYPSATIGHDVYGGGLGRKAGNGQPSVAALVYGDVDVTQYGAILNAAYSQEGLATSGRIFGCNNVNGTPMGHVRVYVVKTTGKDGQLRSSNEYRMDTIANHHTYELSAVYGGGNEAAYEPVGEHDFAEVIVSGCNDISIHSVYGGGNAASTPATKVTVDGAYEIEYVFGGGNGAGTGNPGANVGYRAYADNISGPSSADIDARESFKYGDGIATTAIYGGRIHNVYGGSNTKGNVRQTAVSLFDEVSTCPLVLDGIYGGGREAYMEGATSLELGCITGMEELYGGSEMADVGGDVALTITSGHFGKVFGGNNKGGRIFGSITVNVEQTGCVPITIDTIYLGGNNAPYSIFGYGNTPTEVTINGERVTHYNLISSGDTLYANPKLNIRSFKTIGAVFGGGNGEYAKLIGDPTVDINVTKGWVNGEYLGNIQDYSGYKGTPQEITDGTIGTVYGGGNLAEVEGNTNVMIGDKVGSSVVLQSMTDLYGSLPANGEDKSNIRVEKTTSGDKEAISYTPLDANEQPVTEQTLTKTNEQPVIGATITGNVYGGGNNAHVTGKAYVQIGPDPNDSQAQSAPQRASQPAAQTGRQPSIQSSTPQNQSQSQRSQSQTPQSQSQNQNSSTESLYNRTATPRQSN